jgi:hypothetical protein
MFPTPAERYYRYVAWCLLLGNRVLPKEEYFRELSRIPDYKPIAWNQSSSTA